MPIDVRRPLRGPYLVDKTDWEDPAVRHHLCRLSQVAEGTGSAVIITDIHGAIVWVNDGFTRLTGYCMEEAIGRVPGKLLQGPDTDSSEIARISAALRAQESVSAELINYTKGGRRYWIGMKIEPVKDASGKVDGFMAFEADITERHDRTHALEQLTARFNLATKAAHIGLYKRRGNFDDVWWSEVMWEIFGQDPNVFRPSWDRWLKLIHSDDLERVKATAGSAASARTSAAIQYRVVRPDGSVRHVESIGSVVEKEEDSTNKGSIFGILLDITSRVEAEDREKILQQKLRESSRQAGMAEIATGVIHNVGNVLNSLGIANATARREVNALPIDRLEQATRVMRANRTELAAFLSEDERGKHLIDYLPALSVQLGIQVNSLRSELETTGHLLDHLREIIGAQQKMAQVGGVREPVDVGALAESALLVQASGLGRIEIVRRFEKLPPITTDRHKLLQILVNLISNAADAIRSGGVQPGRILVRIAREGDDALLSVEDSGIGMSAETVSRIWGFGFTTKQHGHGFGLHNSANAAREIGATLLGHSDGVGLGSRFVLRLPLGLPDYMPPGSVA